MGARRPGLVSHPAVVFDSGALIAFERNDRKIRFLVELAFEQRRTVHIPAGVVAQVWRDGRQQTRLARLLASSIVAVDVLDRERAQAVGALCKKTNQHDIVDVSVMFLARRLRARVVTSDPDDLRRIDPEIELVSC